MVHCWHVVELRKASYVKSKKRQQQPCGFHLPFTCLLWHFVCFIYFNETGESWHGIGWRAHNLHKLVMMRKAEYFILLLIIMYFGDCRAIFACSQAKLP